jgi:hypothetical protein
MLEEGNYPLSLKNRIRNGVGHLSNHQALQLFMNHRPPFMSHLLLSHLSKNNNTPQLVENLFNRVSGTTSIIIAPRNNETPVFQIRASISQAVENKVGISHTSEIQQLSLF